ncbi:type II secretion system protein [Kineococcus sp. R86509]|uniref:type II secretion system protein n=1 Tax=Kineococcus sp. R86509 TaxID=3093851 RepID=UPI0036D34222
MRRFPADRDDSGFTLIELLVVMIIIGILAAIAVPVFLQQRQKAVDASLQTDLRSLALQEETYYTDNNGYLAFAATTSPTIIDPVKLSPGVSASVELNSSKQSYCVVVSHPKASQSRVHISSKGGPQPSSVTTCPAATSY